MINSSDPACLKPVALQIVFVSGFSAAPDGPVAFRYG